MEHRVPEPLLSLLREELPEGPQSEGHREKLEVTPEATAPRATASAHSTFAAFRETLLY